MKERGQVFGQKCIALLAKYDQDTQSLRTFQCSFIEELNEYSATLPKSGTIVNGKLWEQTKWEVGIGEKESGLLPTFPTPTQDSAHERTKKYKQGGLPLTIAVKMFPTPTTSDTWTDKLKSSQQKEGSMHSVNLSQAVHMKEMFPTPTSVMHKQDVNDQGEYARRVQEKGHQVSPPASIKLENHQNKTGTLNSDWVEWLMGFPIGWTDLIGPESQKESQE